MTGFERWMLNVHIDLIYNRLQTIWYCCSKDYALPLHGVRVSIGRCFFTSSMNALAHRIYFK